MVHIHPQPREIMVKIRFFFWYPYLGKNTYLVFVDNARASARTSVCKDCAHQAYQQTLEVAKGEHSPKVRISSPDLRRQ